MYLYIYYRQGIWSVPTMYFPDRDRCSFKIRRGARAPVYGYFGGFLKNPPAQNRPNIPTARVIILLNGAVVVFLNPSFYIDRRQNSQKWRSYGYARQTCRCKWRTRAFSAARAIAFSPLKHMDFWVVFALGVGYPDRWNRKPRCGVGISANSDRRVKLRSINLKHV